MDSEIYTSTDFLTFSVDSQIAPASINHAEKTINILVSQFTDLTNITPEFTLAPAAAAFVNNQKQESEISTIDFSNNNVIYKVKGIDGTEANWIVNISHDNDYVNKYYNQKHKISIFPNPANNIIQIKTNMNIETPIQIIDISGKLIYENILPNHKTINISNLRNGIYFVKINHKTIKFVKQN
jgi:hypothetical protein